MPAAGPSRQLHPLLEPSVPGFLPPLPAPSHSHPEAPDANSLRPPCVPGPSGPDCLLLPAAPTHPHHDRAAYSISPSLPLPVPERFGPDFLLPPCAHHCPHHAAHPIG